ncbi:MAG: hypothetical protein Q9217_006031 [Psora testacea]
MSSDEDDLSFSTSTKSPRQARFSFPKIPFGGYRRKSVGQRPSLPFQPRSTGDEESVDEKLEQKEQKEQKEQEEQEEQKEQKEQEESDLGQLQTRVIRSRSNADVLNCKEQWSTSLLAQTSMQNAWKSLQEDAATHEKLAEAGKWKDLMSARANLSELNTLAQKTRERKQKRGRVGKFIKYIDEFCEVALEYSKLLDVIMNAVPDFAALSWGIIKFLLLTEINSAKLRKNVETYLVEIGNQLGLVNQLLSYSPTDVMVEAVASLYSTFTKFLGKALRCYDKNIFMKGIQTLSFPWERKFQPLIDAISHQFCRIQDLAHASHFHVALCSQSLLHRILENQQEDRTASQQIFESKQLRGNVKEELREEVKDEMRQEMNNQISEMFSLFDARWLQKFEDFMAYQQMQASNLESGIYHDHENTSDSALRSGEPSLAPEDYLAEYMATPSDALDFRDGVFPSLKDVESTEQFLRVRNRRLRIAEYRSCAALLKRKEIRQWMTCETSGLLWLESYAESRFTDWMTALVVDISDQASRYDHNTVLRFFCQSRLVGQRTSTTHTALQSLIFQTIVLNNTRLASRSPQFVKQRFEEAEGDTEQLWDLLNDLLEVAEAKRIWLVVDRIGTLEEASDSNAKMLAFIARLNRLAESCDKVVKILITARLGGRLMSSSALRKNRVLAPHHPVVSISRGHGRKTSGQLAGYRTARAQVAAASTTSQASTDVDALLASDSDDSTSEESHIESGATLNIAQAETYLDDTDDTYDSDTLDEDPFASPPSSDDGASIRSQQLAYHSTSSEDSLFRTQSLSQSTPNQPNGFIKDIQFHAKSDVRHQEDEQATSPRTPKIKISPPERSPKTPASTPKTPALENIDTHTKKQPTSLVDTTGSTQRDVRWENCAENGSDESDNISFKLI